MAQPYCSWTHCIRTLHNITHFYNSVRILTKLSHDPALPLTPWVIMTQKCLPIQFYSCTVHRRLKMKPSWRSIHRWIKNVIHIYSEVSCSHKAKQNNDICRAKGCNNFVKRAKPDSRDTNAACFLSHAEPSFKTAPVIIYIYKGRMKLEMRLWDGREQSYRRYDTESAMEHMWQSRR